VSSSSFRSPGRPGRIALEDFGGAATGGPADDQEAANTPPAEGESPFPTPGTAQNLQVERNGQLARIAGALETMASEQAALRSRFLRDAADALGEVAASLLPAMARNGFPILVAEAARSIAENGQWPELAVALAPSDAEEITGYLTASSDPASGMDFGTNGSIRIDARNDMTAGEATLRWDGGGAEIDVDAFTEAVLEEYRRKLDLLAQSGA